MKSRSLFLLISGCAHAGLLLTLSIPIQTTKESAAKLETNPFSLVNIAVIEEVAPPPAPPPTPLPPEPAAPPNPPPVSDTTLAEHYLETEEDTVESTENTAGTSEDTAETSVSASPAALPANTAGNAALAADYARRNYTYIQRRIRDRLVYPSPARRAGIQGTTELAFTIHEDGHISAVTIQKSSGHPILDEAAIETIHAAAPFPRPPAPARLAIPIAFRLR
jgi:protein TonB